MSTFSLNVTAQSHPFAAPLHISGHVFDTADVLVVAIGDGNVVGRGEAAGVYYLGDDPAHMLTAIEGARAAIEAGVTRDELRSILPPGGARSAIDLALWELDSKRTGRPVWELAGVPRPKPVATTFTVGAGEPRIMAEAVRRLADARSIKIKLTGDLDLDIARVRAVRAARPDAWLGVDGNQGFKLADLDRLIEAMQSVKVSLIEQPLARGSEADLHGYRSPIPIAADESALSLEDIPSVLERFDIVNIKLDKCGGLTEALLIAAECRAAGLGVMVGCMPGTSLSIAPGFVLGQMCDLADLDGPLFLKQDCVPGAQYKGGAVWCDDGVWGPSPVAG